MITRVLHGLASNPIIYDLIQVAAGRAKFDRFVAPYLTGLESQIILDAGAGTGSLRKLIPSSNTYVWMDIDWQKLEGFKSKNLEAFALIGDCTRLSFQDKSIDVSTNVALSHHLTDVQLEFFLRELNRVTRKQIMFVDAVRAKRWSSNVLWKYDQGSFPREERSLINSLKKHFEIIKIDNLTVFHKYLLCIGTPR